MKLESNPSEGTITCRGMIGNFDNAISADDFRALLDEHEGKDVTILLNSEGGSVIDGLSIFNALAEYEGKVTVHIDALCASIATVIACAADRVTMNSTAKYMIHRCWTAAAGNCTEFRHLADTMELLDGDIADVYAERTGLSKDELLAMMTEESWFTAEGALEAGLVDEVVKVSAKKAKPQAQLESEVKSVIQPSFHSRLLAEIHSRRLKLRQDRP